MNKIHLLGLFMMGLGLALFVVNFSSFWRSGLAEFCRQYVTLLVVLALSAFVVVVVVYLQQNDFILQVGLTCVVDVAK